MSRDRMLFCAALISGRHLGMALLGLPCATRGAPPANIASRRTRTRRYGLQHLYRGGRGTFLYSAISDAPHPVSLFLV